MRRVIEPNAFVADYLKELSPREPVNGRIHEDDEMFVFLLVHKRGNRDLASGNYLETGKAIADSVRDLVKWKFGGYQNVQKFLDFASGYGRVTRFLVQDIEPRRLWVSEISLAAVEFQKENLGVQGFVSVSQPGALSVEERFDCILVLSLFTHLPASTFVRWLEKLYSLLTPNGLLIISTHDESLRPGNPSDGPMLWFEEASEIATLDKKEYGSTTVNEHYVRAAIQEATRGQGSYYRIPKAINLYQDLYVITGQPTPDFNDLRVSVGPPGYVDSVSFLEPGVLQVTGWAFDWLSGSKMAEVRVEVQGDLLQRCTPLTSRPDIAEYFKNPNGELSGFSCVGRVSSSGGSSSAAALKVSATKSGGESFTIYDGKVGTALKLRG